MQEIEERPPHEHMLSLSAWVSDEPDDTVDAAVDEELGLLRPAQDSPAEVVRWWRDRQVCSFSILSSLSCSS